MEEQNNQNLKQQEIEQKENEQLPKEEVKEINIQTPTKKPFTKFAIGAIAVVVVAIIVVLIILLGSNKGGNITCESCGASISENVKFCSNCGNAFDNVENNGNNYGNNNGNPNNNGETIDNNKEEISNDTASYIAHCFIQYDKNSNSFCFSFALQDENQVEIAVDATVEMRIENSYGTEVYNGKKYVDKNDYSEWYNTFDRWIGTAVYISTSEITAGSIEKGTLYYKVSTADGTYFQYSIDIDEGLPVVEINYQVGDVWNVKDNWNFTIDSISTHYACNSYYAKNEPQKNNYPQYIIITYSYENLGYDYYSSGLGFSFTDFDVYDENGEIADFYTCSDHSKSYQYIDKNGKCSKAQVVFGLNNSSSSIRIVVSQNTDVGELKATFMANVVEHTHTYSDWEIVRTASCTTEGSKKRVCSCGKNETAIIEKVAHNFSSGKCVSCGAIDLNYKTPDIILGEYVQTNGTVQSNGSYVISWQDETTKMATMTQIIWNPTEKFLTFAQVSATSVAVTTAGIIYEHGASKQKITVINDQTATGLTGYKITGIGYIYPNTYKISNNSIYSYQCDTSSSSLITANKRLAESSITALVDDIDGWLIKNTDFDIGDFGFTSW